MNHNVKDMDRILRTLNAITKKFNIYFPMIEYRKGEYGTKIPQGYYQPISHNMIIFRTKS